MNALADKAHKQGMSHSDMHSITLFRNLFMETCFCSFLISMKIISLAHALRLVIAWAAACFKLKHPWEISPRSMAVLTASLKVLAGFSWRRKKMNNSGF